MEWTNIIRDDLVTNKQLHARGCKLGLDACVIKDPGTPTVSIKMLSTTFEAIIAAVHVDSGEETYDTVHGIMERLGFFDHHMLMVTYCDSRLFVLAYIQMIINVRGLDLG